MAKVINVAGDREQNVKNSIDSVEGRLWERRAILLDNAIKKGPSSSEYKKAKMILDALDSAWASGPKLKTN